MIVGSGVLWVTVGFQVGLQYSELSVSFQFEYYNLV